ncbi:MAG: M20 family metallopeptidase [Patescibacteria group bacterium]
MELHIPTVELLKKLVSINSITGNEENIAKYIFEILKSTKETKVTMQKVDEQRFNVIAKRGEGSKNILLYGHMDTVAICDGWTKEPHKPKVIGDKLYGLGAYDMKGGVAALLESFSKSKLENISLTLALTVDEEEFGKGCEVFLKSYDFKNTIAGICCEPGFQHGLQGIVTGRSGWGVMELEITQPSKHFVHYDRKIDMALIFAKVTQIIDSYSRFEKNGGKQFLSLRSIDMDCKGMSVAERLLAKYECSILPPDDGWSLATKIEKSINEAIDKEFDLSIAIDVVFKTGAETYYAPYSHGTDNKVFSALSRSVKENTGKDAIPYLRPSVSDENILAAHGIYTLGIGPTGANAHAADEWVSISSVEKLSEILKATLEKVDKN